MSLAGSGGHVHLPPFRRCRGYTPGSQIDTITAVNSATGNQVTENLYGSTLAGSDVARNDVQVGILYADGGEVSYLVNRQSEIKEFTDQRGVVHTRLGRVMRGES